MNLKIWWGKQETTPPTTDEAMAAKLRCKAAELEDLWKQANAMGLDVTIWTFGNLVDTPRIEVVVGKRL